MWSFKLYCIVLYLSYRNHIFTPVHPAFPNQTQSHIIQIQILEFVGYLTLYAERYD